MVQAGDFAHLFGLAMALGIAVFLLLVLIIGSRGDQYGTILCIILLMSMSTAPVFVVAAWSVFGFGSYLSRLFWSHLAAAIVAVGYVAGMAVITTSNLDANVWLNFWKGIGFTILLTPLISLAAQLPFWFFRFFFGWQFTFCDSVPADPFTLRDIFGFTFFCAIALGATQFAANRGGPLGLTPDAVWIQLGVSALFTFVLSVISFPVVPIIFSNDETGPGFALAFAYAFAWVVLIVAVVTVLSPFGSQIEFIGVLSLLILSYGTFISIPFVISRQKGFQLTSLRRQQKINSQKS